ncbi:MAG: hypothetical protein ACRD92_07315 [Nitrosopumilaceae archaeon]
MKLRLPQSTVRETSCYIKTLKSIQEAWQEIENGKGGKAKVSKFFMEFARW